MAQTYTRQSTLSDGDTITASLFNNEYNQLVNAFSYSSSDAATTGHRHDGTTAQGGNIHTIGDLNFFNKIVVDSTNNRWGVFVEVGGSPVEQVRIQDGGIVPVTTNDIDLGTASLQFKDIFIDGTANIDSLILTSGATVTTILDEDDLVSNSATALVTQQSVKAYIDAQVTAQDLDIVGDTGTDSIDLDSETITFTGGTGITSVVTTGVVTHNIDSTVTTLTGTQTLTNKTLTSPIVTTPDIDGGTVDGANITVGAAKTLDVSAGTLTLADNQISGDKVEGGTIAATTITALTFGSLNDGVVTVTAWADEDDMVSNSATLVPTQQSVKAYVDAQVTAQDLDIVGDTGTDAIDLDSETITFAGGTGITSVVTAGTVTHNIDSTVTTLTGTQTLTNKTLTAPDINGGTIDEADITVGAAKTLDVSAGTLTLADNQISGDKVEGGTIAAVTITAMTGTLQTAAQPNVTSLGTIASLVATTADINAGTIDGTVIGGTTAAAGTFTDVVAASLDISGDIDVDGTTNLDVVDIDGAVDMASTLQVDGVATFTTEIQASGGIAVVEATPSMHFESTTTAIGAGNSFGDLTWYSNDSSSASTGILAKINAVANRNFDGDQSATGMDLTFSTVNLTGKNSPVERLRIDYAGNTVFNDTGVDADFRVESDTNTHALFVQGSDGNVGIGTNAPSAKLQISQDSAGAYVGASIVNTNAGGYSNLTLTAGSGTGGIYYAPSIFFAIGPAAGDTNTPIVFRNNNATERMRIDSSGNVNLTTANDTAGTSKFLTFGTTSFNRAGIKCTNAATYDGSLEFYTGNASNFAERMRIDASGNVGIGTSSPSAKLDIASTSGSSILRITSTTTGMAQGATIGALEFYNSDSDAPRVTAEIRAVAPHTYGYDGALAFYTSYSTGTREERMRIDASGNVGIGISSPNAKLAFGGDSDIAFNASLGATGTYGQIKAFNTLAPANPATNIRFIRDIAVVGNDGAICFDTVNTERMRIDSSGNLLVGTTVSGVGVGNTSTGHNINANGALLASRTTTGDTSVAYFNRNSSDGKIAEFYKDGATVGSIGTVSGLLGIGSGDAILAFDGTSNAMYPMSSQAGGASNGVLDFGASLRRFKDLYLSGGVYLGGTGAANHLDDYEEGTFTPTFANFGNGTYAVQSGRYTKIGNQVICHIYLGIAALGTASGFIIVGGLPFSAANVGLLYGSTSAVHGTGWTTATAGLQGLIAPNDTQVSFYEGMASLGSGYLTAMADIGIGNLLFSVTYTTA